jgi:hypothetical protein
MFSRKSKVIGLLLFILGERAQVSAAGVESGDLNLFYY